MAYGSQDSTFLKQKCEENLFKKPIIRSNALPTCVFPDLENMDFSFRNLSFTFTDLQSLKADYQ